ncbi:MAG: YgiT-type zinc finger protein [Candidatus Schekmanbacteria bacterium]|nr:YgiT-type zinc finger protein [Candidatus Schekmanbacteria bacterium]
MGKFCANCGGRLIKKAVTLDQHWGEQIVVFEDVPAKVCKDCQAIWRSCEVLESMDRILTQNVKPEKKLAVPVWSLTNRLKNAA